MHPVDGTDIVDVPADVVRRGFVGFGEAPEAVALLDLDGDIADAAGLRLALRLGTVEDQEQNDDKRGKYEDGEDLLV